MTDDRWDKLDALAAAAQPEQGHWWTVEFLRLFENEDDEPIIDMVDAAFIAACDPATIRDLVAAARERDETDEERWNRLPEIVSDSLAASTEGTDWAEAPEPSDEPGSPYVLRLSNEIASRLWPALHRKDGADD